MIDSTGARRLPIPELERINGEPRFTYTVLFEPAEDGGYVVTCPALPGLVTEDDSLEEARAMAADAIRGYLEGLVKDGEPIPPDRVAEPIAEKVKGVVKHPDTPGLRVTVPYHTKDLKRGTLAAMIKAADLTPEQFRELL